MTLSRPLKTLSRRGFALISAATLMALVLVFGALLVNYMMSTRHTGRAYETVVYAQSIAEAGIDKALFCLNATSGTKCGGSYGTGYTGEADVSMGDGGFTAVVSGSGHTRTVTVTGTRANGTHEAIVAEVSDEPPTTGGGFNYSLQVGSGGASIGKHTSITGGPIYSEQDITCDDTTATGPIYVSKAGGLITKCTLSGDAHADSVTVNEMNNHDVYFKTANTSNTHVGTAYGSQPTPGQQPMPDLHIPAWQKAAAAGGVIYGDHSPADNSHFGPKKITGNLTLGNNVDIILDGPIWVQGTVYFGNNSTISLNTKFGPNSTMVLVDGVITVNNNAQLNGSGNIKSFVVLYTPSAATPAVDIENNVGGAVFFAPNGNIDIKNNAAITAAVGKSVTMANNTSINYKTTYHDASDILLASEPSGTWQITAGTWREFKQ